MQFAQVCLIFNELVLKHHFCGVIQILNVCVHCRTRKCHLISYMIFLTLLTIALNQGHSLEVFMFLEFVFLHFNGFACLRIMYVHFRLLMSGY